MPLDMTPEQAASVKRRIQNRDGSVSTERSITVQHGGKWINLPSVDKGVQLTPQMAVRRALRRKNYQEFNTLSEAEKAAKERSNQIGNALKRKLRGY